MKKIYADDLICLVKGDPQTEDWHGTITVKKLERIVEDMHAAPGEIDLYQINASRTINRDLRNAEQGKHALHGMVSEIGELHSIYQKRYQGHTFDETHAKKELGDLMWFIAEYCTAHHWKLSDICDMNIEKLKQRYPEGFRAAQSIHRKEGDI